MMSMEHWSVADIESRLSQITVAEVAHAARDLDAELAEVMRKGGDLDAMETAHLESERAARRLRVERAALETELPEARKREGAVRVSALTAQHAEIRQRAPRCEARLTAAWRELLAAAIEWGDLQASAASLTQEASVEATKSGASMPPMGSLRSFVVEELQRDFNRHELTLQNSLHQPTVLTGHGLQSFELASAPQAKAA